MNLIALASGLASGLVSNRASNLVSNLVSGPAASAPQSPESTSPESTRESKRIQQSARQFETQLLTSLLTSLETSMGSVPGSEESGASAQYHALATQGLATAWAAAGGVGIARILTRALSHTPKSAAPVLPAGLPAAAWLAHSSFSPKGR